MTVRDKSKEVLAADMKLRALLALFCLLSARYSVSHAIHESPSERTDTLYRTFAQGRWLLNGGNADKALTLFERTWNEISAGKLHDANDLELDTIAFYAGLCAQANGNERQAKKWFRLAHEHVLAAQQMPARAVLYYLASRGEQAKLEEQNGIASTSTSHVALLQVNNPTHADYLDKAKAQLGDAIKSFQQSGDLNSRIMLMTWYLMHAELASDVKEAGMYSTALDHFSEGWQFFHDVEKEIINEKDEAKISQNPRVAMMLDADRARLIAMQMTDKKTRERERNRVVQMCDLMMSFRQTTEHLNDALTQLALSNNDGAKQAAERARQAIDIAKQVLKLREGETDFFIFKNEPDWKIEFKPAQYAELPAFTASFDAQSKAIQALLAVVEASGKKDKNALENAVELAKQATAEAPKKTEDLAYRLGHYAAGLGEEARAFAETADAPHIKKRHDDAKDHFKNAKSHFQTVIESVDTLPDPRLREAFKTAKDDAMKRKLELASRDVFLDRAIDATNKERRPDKAYIELKSGATRHWDTETWRRAIEAGLRSYEVDLDSVRNDFENALKHGVLSDTDYETHVLQGRILLAELLRDKGLLREAEGRNEAEGKLLSIKQRIADRASQAANVFLSGKSRARDASKNFGQLVCDTYRMYAIALNPRLTEEGLRDAGDKVQGLIDDLLLEENRPNVDKLQLREAIVVSKLAWGYLAVQLELSYQTKAVPAFVDAIDEAALLPYVNREWATTLGYPLLEAIRKRTEESFLVIGQDEQRLRMAMGHVVDGVIALYWKNNSLAYKKMLEAEKASATPEMLLTKDKFLALVQSEKYKQAYRGTKRDVQSEIIAFTTLIHLADGQADAACVLLLEWLVNDRVLPLGNAADVVYEPDATTITKAMSRGGSPYVWYALAEALEQRLVKSGLALLARNDLDLNKLREHEVLRAQLDRVLTYIKYDVLPDDSASRKQFPEIGAAIDRAKKRLSSSDENIKLAVKLRSQHRLEEAIDVVEQAVARKPDTPILWPLLLSYSMDAVDTDVQPTKKDFADTLRLLYLMKGMAPSAEYERWFWTGALHARLDEEREAESAFQQAASLARIPSDEARAKARATEVKYRGVRFP